VIEVEVEVEAWTAALPDADALVMTAAEATLDRFSLSLHPSSPEGRDVTVLLTDDATVKDLNARFRNKDTPTNVLSFPAPATASPHLGDIVLAYGVCMREAEIEEKPLAHHLLHLIAHGVLHLLGYDHETDADAEAMEGLERDILAGLGVPDPYRLDAHAPDEPAPSEPNVPV
jgi:probable rRNA maturation factor